MRLVLLYGPPAAGKLTTAEEIAALTGYRLFHNHVTRDAVTALLPAHAPGFTPTLRALRIALLEAAADAGVPGVIFTFCFYRGEDEPFIDHVCEIVEARGGDVAFVQVACDRATLERRVERASRHRFGKLSDKAGLARVLAQHDATSPVPGRPSLRLDTASRSASDNARRVVDFYGLPVLALPRVAVG